MILRYVAIFIILIVPFIFLSCYTLRYILLQYSCLQIRKIKSENGKWDYFPSEKPDFWHRKMHYLRIIELLTLRENRVNYYSLCGGKIENNVVSDGYISDPDLLEVGENSIIGTDSLIVSHLIERNIITLSKVRIGKNCTIGGRAIIMPGCDIGDNVIIGSNSLVLKNSKIPSNSVWVGNPVHELKKRDTI